MAGLPKSVNTDIPIDSHFLSYINNLSSGGNTTNVTSSKDTIKQYVKTKNGIFNGAFGSVGHALTISSGELDLTANSTGAVVVRRMIQVNPESSTSDTLDKIESNGLELPYQELTLIATTNNTITLAHASSVSGTQKNIYCPGDTSYVLAPNEAVKLIYDPVNTIWLVTGSNSSSGSTTLSALTDTNITSVSSGQVLIYDGSNSWDNKSLSGDVTINTSGVTAIGANKITNTMMADDSIGINELSATGSSISSKFLRGDNTWQTVSSGSTSFVGFTADDDLSMGTYNIDGVDQLIFSTSTSSDSPTWTTTDYGFEIAGGTSPTALDIRVPTGKYVNVKVAGTTEFTFKSNELDCLDNDVCNVGTIFTDYISMSSGNDNVRVWGNLNPISNNAYDLGTSSLKWKDLYLSGNLQVDGNTTLGTYSGGHEVNLNAKLDFRDHTNSTNQTASDSDGYIEILVGGVSKKLYYY
jgi:hypothetical protein|tara:strand:- start:22 stop:1425 length:1404 start_codon:yes stop_codon:yes gene_type:complete